MDFKDETITTFTSEFLNNGECERLAVVILNWKLPSVTPHLLRKASLCICADGGANRLHDEIPTMFPEEDPHAVRSRFLPNIIKGDLDSIRPDVLQYYQEKGVVIRDLSHDQGSTDLQKCIVCIESTFALNKNEQKERGNISTPPTQVVAVGAHGGRLDHILSNLSTLHAFSHMNIVLCGDGNLTRLIPAGRAIIKPYSSLEGPMCGLIPLLGPAVASSRGLRWNLDSTEMRMGGLVSTSNVIEGDEVWVETDSDIIWTTELRDEEKSWR